MTVKHVHAGVHLPGGWSESPEKDGERTPEGFEVRIYTYNACFHVTL